MTACLLSKMSADNLQHINSEITENANGTCMSLQEPVEKHEGDVLYTHCINTRKYLLCLLGLCQGFTVQQTELLSTECTVY